MLDPRIVDEAFRLPPGLKWREGVEKWVLRRAVERRGLLPRSVLWRKKHPFSGPISAWMRKLPPGLEQALSPASLNRQGYFDPGAVATLLAECQRAPLTPSVRTIYSDVLFAVLVFTLWADRVLQN